MFESGQRNGIELFKALGSILDLNAYVEDMDAYPKFNNLLAQVLTVKKTASDGVEALKKCLDKTEEQPWIEYAGLVKETRSRGESAWMLPDTEVVKSFHEGAVVTAEVIEAIKSRPADPEKHGREISSVIRILKDRINEFEKLVGLKE